MSGTRFRRSSSIAAILALVLLVPTTAQAGFTDASDTCAGATPITPGTGWTHDTIGVPGDQDWFSFSAPPSGYVLITLGGLPINERLDLYHGCGTLLATSARPGLQYEEVYRHLAPGTYRVKVTGVGGAASASAYALRVRPLGAGVRILSSSGWLEFPNEPRIVGEVINDSSLDRESVSIKIRFYDVADTLIRTGVTYARRERFGSGKRSMFVWSYETIKGYDHYSVVVKKAPVASIPPYPGLVVHPGAATPDCCGGIDFGGSLENTTGHKVGIPRVMLTVYDAWGRVRNADFHDTSPDPMHVHSSNPYLIHLNDHNDGNRFVFVAHGYRH